MDEYMNMNTQFSDSEEA